VAVGISLLVGLALGAILIATLRAVSQQALVRATDDLDVARVTLARSLTTRAESAASLTRLITELPIFRAHLTDGRLASDRQSVDEMADRYRRQLDAQFCVVTNSDGAWIGQPGWEGDTHPDEVRTPIAGALAGRPQHAVVALRHGLDAVAGLRQLPVGVPGCSDPTYA
jgi:hypothetical protein